MFCSIEQKVVLISISPYFKGFFNTPHGYGTLVYPVFCDVDIAFESWRVAEFLFVNFLPFAGDVWLGAAKPGGPEQPHSIVFLGLAKIQNQIIVVQKCCAREMRDALQRP